MADREDRRVDATQPLHRDPVPDRLLAQPERMQLPPADDAVLPRGELGQRTSGWARVSVSRCTTPAICCHASDRGVAVSRRVWRCGRECYLWRTVSQFTVRSPRSVKAVSLPGPQSISVALAAAEGVDRVVAVAAEHAVAAGVGAQLVVARAAVDDVGAAAAGDAVVALVALRGGRAALLPKIVSLPGAREHVVGAARAGHVVAPDHVVAAEALDSVVAGAAEQRVVQVGAVERVGRAGRRSAAAPAGGRPAREAARAPPSRSRGSASRGCRGGPRRRCRSRRRSRSRPPTAGPSGSTALIDVVARRRPRSSRGRSSRSACRRRGRRAAGPRRCRRRAGRCRRRRSPCHPPAPPSTTSLPGPP